MAAALLVMEPSSSYIMDNPTSMSKESQSTPLVNKAAHLCHDGIDRHNGNHHHLAQLCTTERRGGCSSSDAQQSKDSNSTVVVGYHSSNPVRPGITPIITTSTTCTSSASSPAKMMVMSSNNNNNNTFTRSNSTRSSSSVSSSTSRSSSTSSSIVHAIDFAYPSGSFDGTYPDRRRNSSRRSTNASGTSRASMSIMTTGSSSLGDGRRKHSTAGYSVDRSCSSNNNATKHHPSLSRSSTSSSASTSLSTSTSISAATSSSSFACGCSSSSSATSSRRSSSSSSSSSSLACQFRDWALSADSDYDTHDTLSSTHNTGDNNKHLQFQLSPYSNAVDSSNTVNTNTNGGNKAKQSLLLLPPLSCTSPFPKANETSGEGDDIFSPMTDVPPLPPSVFPPGISSEEDVLDDDDDIEDVDGIVCFQPGCNTTISPGTYYCQEHDDPFGDDP
ncbi:hypothetical protein P389DRAFT_9080 [Cystobasidium minutum MCA 4210]|uniref:uncharacterized protein n=1 Tax=Cystobasidium minutum MCA 4210 TaxID=1397322 RepID=UPI0034CF30D2|eukprot:jgi/Rhomi1/9080/CE9079_651